SKIECIESVLSVFSTSNTNRTQIFGELFHDPTTKYSTQTTFRTPTSLLFQFQNHMTKVSENNSVIPQDRIGISYNLLNDVELRSGFGGFVPGDDQEISDFKFRYEKTFFD
ncbi:MAG: hypothetical protein P8M30_04680, partial [Planctomycetaceae bacterium]|nr:hypothetical protein [Planctomycetaceae bacterium]